ncbi:MAG: capsule assembly Wzi family protein [Bacteroidia bacterium]
MNREFGLNYEDEIAHIKNSETIAESFGNGGASGWRDTLNNAFNTISNFKPYIVPFIHKQKDKSKPLLYRKFKKESLFIVNDTADKFYLTIDPLFNFQLGTDLADKTHEKLYTNTRGFLVRGSIGSKFAFESSFYENQATYAKYIDNYIAGTNNLFPQNANYFYDVIPGQGRSKVFKKNGYDYAMASGYVSYSPVKLVNVQVGHGKNFVGDGYRSLLLSDNAFNYPYARITTTYKNIQYTNLYTSFMNLTDGGVKTPPHIERLFQKKIGSFQMLSVNLFHRLQLGLFQGMIWEAADSTNRQHTNFNTFDPVIGVNALSYGMHNKNNVLLGATMKLKITKSISLYGQYMLDDVASKNASEIRNKYGYQVGFKYFDLFTIKNLHLQFEYNSVRPYAYASSNPEQSYTHYNQALAHPLGANFNEMVGFINYRVKDFFIEIKANYAIKGADSSTYNYGSNIFKSDNVFPLNQDLNTISTTQGLKTTIMYQDIHIGYLMNPSTNFNIVFGVSNRIEKTEKATNKTQFVYFGIRTSLSNFYYDF